MSDASGNAQWTALLAALKAYRDEHGHAKVPYRFQPNPELGKWVHRLRRMKAAGRLGASQVKALDALGFAWAAEDAKQDDLWERRFREVLAYKERHGHLRIGTEDVRRASPFEVWVSKQRRLYKDGRLDAVRRAKLEAVGFEWDLRATQWELMFARLVDYKRTRGHVSPPRRGSGDDQLAIWAQNQRIFKRNGKLSASRIAALEELGFDWEPKQAVKPDDRVAELRVFRRRHGHFAVPFASHSGLVQWMQHKQKLHSEAKLDRRLQRQLDRLGFPWTDEERDWERWFARTKELVERTGSFEAAPSTAIAKWLTEQQRAMEHGRLDLDRSNRLAALGFWKWAAWRRR